MIELLKSISQKKFESEDGDIFSLNLYKGLSDTEILELRKKLPKQHLPKEIEQLLKFSKGFDCSPIQEVNFTAYGHFGFEEAFPHSVQLAGDGFGNFWIVDIDDEGNWNEIFYVCHDPPVIIKQANNLIEFIKQIEDLAENPRNSFINKIHEEIVNKIWDEEKRNIYENYPIKNLALKYHTEVDVKDYVADLKEKPIGEGFVWALNGSNTIIERISDSPIWAIENRKSGIEKDSTKKDQKQNSFNLLKWLQGFWKKSQ